MRCGERRCDECKEPTAVWVHYVAADRVLCAACLPVPPVPAVDHTGLTEATCEQCGHLFATDPEHTTFFCSMTCEQKWRANHTFDKVPF